MLSFYDWIVSLIDQLQFGIWDLSHLVITTCTVNKCTELLHKVWLGIVRADNALVSIRLGMLSNLLVLQ